MSIARITVIAVSLSFTLASNSFAQDAVPSIPATPITAPVKTQDSGQAKPKAARKDIYDEKADAKQQIADALANAKRENRRVLVQWGANWCGWCHRLEDWMAKPEIAKILAKDFVDVKIDVDRTVGGNDIMQRFAGEKPKGIPWFAFVDPATGKAIITSDDAKGANVGFPAAEHEIAHFGEMLAKTARNVTMDDIDVLVKSLEAANKKQ